MKIIKPGCIRFYKKAGALNTVETREALKFNNQLLKELYEKNNMSGIYKKEINETQNIIDKLQKEIMEGTKKSKEG